MAPKARAKAKAQALRLQVKNEKRGEPWPPAGLCPCVTAVRPPLLRVCACL